MADWQISFVSGFLDFARIRVRSSVLCERRPQACSGSRHTATGFTSSTSGSICLLRLLTLYGQKTASIVAPSKSLVDKISQEVLGVIRLAAASPRRPPSRVRLDS
jgi:hypothetical protein